MRGSEDASDVSGERVNRKPVRVQFAGAAGVSLERAEELLPRDLIQDDEVIILLLRPSILFVPLTSVGSLMVIAILTLLAMWLGRLMVGSPWVFWTDAQALALGVAIAAARLIWQTLEWMGRVYVLTDRRLIRRRGVLRVAVFQTLLSNIQHTSVFALLRERIFGLGTIGFATAGSDTYEAFWVMIPDPYGVHKIVDDAIRRYGRGSRV